MTRFLNSFEVGDVVVAQACGQRPRMAEVSELSVHDGVVVKFGDDIPHVFPIEHVRLLVPGDSIYVDTKYAPPNWFEVESCEAWNSITARRKVGLFKSERVCCIGSFIVGERNV